MNTFLLTINKSSLFIKETVIGVVTTGKITQPAKNLLDEADIAWIENFPETELQNIKDR